MSIPNASKYVIIGAGIHGLSTAYHLALELKKRNLGGGYRPKNSGMPGWIGFGTHFFTL